ncbi:MAG: PorT family protein [Flavobacterium sp.]|nr:MAG: PorT family protein [Flavobacterium sp.]
MNLCTNPNAIRLLWLILLFPFITTYSQSKFSYGFHGGSSFSVLFVSGLSFEDPFSTKVGLLLGAHGNYHLSKRSSLVANLNIEQKGAKTTFNEINDPSTGLPYGVNEKISLNYLTLPLLYRYTMGGGSLGLFVNAGPYVGLLVGSKNDDMTMADFETLDFGISGGLGLNYELKTKNLITLELRVNIGGEHISKIVVFNDRLVRGASTNIIFGYTID